jgi:hypothetical protein
MEHTLSGSAGVMTPPADMSRSAVSWPAIVAGAFVAAAVSLILFALGSGLGLASLSAWPGHGASAKSVAVYAAVWLIVTQWIAAGTGGYIAGRLRTKWVGTHTHEVFFRDTAHGLITWSVATLLLAIALTSTVFGAIGAGTRAASNTVGEPGRSGYAQSSAYSAYDEDLLFRSPNPSPNSTNDAQAQVGRVIANGIKAGSFPDADRTYLAQLVANKTGVPMAEAQQRVNDFITKATDAADAARKAAAQSSLYLALSLLVGAFIASVSAALGGRLRDQHI